jgi:hypothetical protein
MAPKGKTNKAQEKNNEKLEHVMNKEASNSDLLNKEASNSDLLNKEASNSEELNDTPSVDTLSIDTTISVITSEVVIELAKHNEIYTTALNEAVLINKEITEQNAKLMTLCRRKRANQLKLATIK